MTRKHNNVSAHPCLAPSIMEIFTYPTTSFVVLEIRKGKELAVTRDIIESRFFLYPKTEMS